MLGIQIPPVNDPLVVKDTVAENPNRFQIRLPLFAFVQAFGKAGEDPFEGTRQKWGALFVIIFEEAGPESKLKLGNNPPRYHRFSSLIDFGLSLGYLRRSPRSEREAGGIIPILASHDPRSVSVNRIAERDFAKLQRRIQALAKCHVQEVASERHTWIRRVAVLPSGVCRQPFIGKALLDLLEKVGVHRKECVEKSNLISPCLWCIFDP